MPYVIKQQNMELKCSSNASKKLVLPIFNTINFSTFFWNAVCRFDDDSKHYVRKSELNQFYLTLMSGNMF